jgi:hypothetical protein
MLLLEEVDSFMQDRRKGKSTNLGHNKTTEAGMHSDQDSGLDESEVLQRNQLIADILDYIGRLDQTYSLGLSLDGFRRMLEPGTPDYFVIRGPKRVYGCEWVRSTRDSIHQSIFRQISKEVLSGVHARARNDVCLQGSAFSIAMKLCAEHLGLDKLHDLEHFGEAVHLADFGEAIHPPCDADDFVPNFYAMVEYVEDEYKRNYMTYRLWDRKSLYSLTHYLYCGPDEDTDFVDGGALWSYLYSEGEPVALDKFIEAVDSAIIALPLNNLTESLYPDDCTGINFAEYVPAENMTPSQKDLLYQRYLNTL